MQNFAQLLPFASYLRFKLNWTLLCVIVLLFTNLPKERKDSKTLYYSLNLQKSLLLKKTLEIWNPARTVLLAVSYFRFRLPLHYSGTANGALMSMVSGVYHLLHMCRENTNFRAQFSAENCLSFYFLNFFIIFINCFYVCSAKRRT